MTLSGLPYIALASAKSTSSHDRLINSGSHGFLESSSRYCYEHTDSPLKGTFLPPIFASEKTQILNGFLRHTNKNQEILVIS